MVTSSLPERTPDRDPHENPTKSSFAGHLSSANMPEKKTRAPPKDPPPPSDTETGTEAGIEDEAVRAQVREEKAKIAAAQEKISKLTGRFSRTGSVAASGISKGSAKCSVTHSVTKTVQATPTTYLDPTTGELKVVPTPPPPVPRRSELLDSLPDAPYIPPIQTSPEEDPLPAQPGVSGAAPQVTFSASKKEGVHSGLDQGSKEAEKGRVLMGKPLGEETMFTRVLLKSVASGYHYKIFLAGPHDYEVGDTIVIKTKAGKEMTSLIIELGPGKPGPLDSTGVVTMLELPTDESPASKEQKGQEGKAEGEEEEDKSGERSREEADEQRPRRSARAAAIAKAEKRRKGYYEPDVAGPSAPKKKAVDMPDPKEGTSKGWQPVGKWSADAYAQLSDADKARGLDREPAGGLEPAGLRQIWEWDEEMVRRAQELARKVANMPQDERLTTRGQVKVRELEALLHSKTSTKPKEVPPMGDTEEALEKEKITGKETDRELALIAARNSRISAKAALCNTRGIQLCIQKMDLHSHTLSLILEHLESIRRILTRYDRPELKQGEIMANPNLNPLLAGYVPFDNQVAVNTFFESEERGVELHRWVLSKMHWDPSSFIPRLCEMVCTREYRIKYSYPGKQLMKNLVYIPERLATFLFGVAQSAAVKFGGFNPEKAEEQLRVAFQASQVAKRPMLDAEGKPVKKRRRDDAVFTTSEEEGSDDDEDSSALRFADNFEHTLVDYRSYLASDSEDNDIDATKD